GVWCCFSPETVFLFVCSQIWISHTNSSSHAEGQLNLLQRCPQWDCRLVSRCDSQSETRTVEESPAPPPQTANDTQKPRLKKPPQKKASDRSKVVCVKFAAQAVDETYLRNLTQPFGKIVKILMFPSLAFVELGSNDQAKDLVKFHVSSPLTVKGQKVEFSLSNTFNFLQSSKVISFSPAPKGDNGQSDLLSVVKRFGPPLYTLFLPSKAFVEMKNAADAQKLVDYYSSNSLRVNNHLITVCFSGEYNSLMRVTSARKYEEETPVSKRTRTRSRSPESEDKTDGKRTRRSRSRDGSRSREKRSGSRDETRSTNTSSRNRRSRSRSCGSKTRETKVEPEKPETQTRTDAGPGPVPDSRPEPEPAETQQSEEEEESEDESDIEGMEVIGEDDEDEDEDEEDKHCPAEDTETLSEEKEDMDTEKKEKDMDTEKEEKDMDTEKKEKDMNPEKEEKDMNTEKEDVDTEKKEKDMDTEKKEDKEKDMDTEKKEDMDTEKEEDMDTEKKDMEEKSRSETRKTTETRPEDEEDTDFFLDLENCITLDELEDEEEIADEPESSSTRVVFFKNLPQRFYTDEDFVRLVDSLGTATRYFLLRRRGQGFIEMSTSSDAVKVVRDLNCTLFHGSRLDVNVSHKYNRLTNGFDVQLDSNQVNRSQSQGRGSTRSNEGTRESGSRKAPERESGSKKAPERESGSRKILSETTHPAEQNWTDGCPDNEKTSEDAVESEQESTKKDSRESPGPEEDQESEKNPDPPQTEQEAAPVGGAAEPQKPSKPVGSKFVRPVVAYLCSLCDEIYADEDEAKLQHCSSLTHYRKYQEKTGLDPWTS
ncbi:matrin-3-like isoform X2, partial [Solea senegalensis]